MTITVTPTVELSNWPPRVRLNVSADAGETSSTITRLDPSGAVVPVRTSDGNPLPISGGSGLVYDYEMQFGAKVAYSSVESPGTVSGTVSVGDTRVWLIHPGVPSLSTPITLRPGSLNEETFTASQGVFWVQARSTAVVVTDGARKASQSQLVVLAKSSAEYSTLRALIADAGVLLLNIPAANDWGFDTCYIAVTNVKVTRLVDRVNANWRDVVMPFVVVDRPAGGSQAQRTWADVLATNTTWAALQSRYGTWADVLAGP